jgi:pilus assembly protein CpaE
VSPLATRFLVILDDGIADLPIRASLPPTAPVEVVRLGDVVDRTGELVSRLAPDLVLVGCSPRSEGALQTIGELSGEHGCPTVVLYDGAPNGFLEAAFRAGAEDLIVLPQPAGQLAFALEKVIARRRKSGSPAGPGSMISILGPKGGTGKTLTACNLAVALARAGARPVVVDLDLQFGDVGLALGATPRHTVYDLAVSGGSLDGEKIDSFLVDHASGARLLLAPTQPDQAAAIGIPFLRQVFELLRARYDFVIVDTPPAFSPEVIAAIDASSHLCVVGMLDTLSLKDTRIGFETLQKMGYEPGDTTLVLNRADSSVGIGRDDVERLLGKAPDVLVPSDRTVPRVLTSGRAIVEAEPKSGPGRAFAALASRYLDERARSEGSGNHDRADRGGQRLALLRKAS